jgi:hypothetical protein
MGRGATSTLRAAPRIAAADAIRACFAALGFGAAALVLVYVAVRVTGRLVEGDGHGAARWATLSFGAALPFAFGYGALEVRRVRVAALAAPAAVIAGALILQGALGAGSYFVTDDWLHIAVAQDALTGSGIDVHYLGRVVFIHYAPGHRLAYYLLAKLAPLDWSAALGAMLVLFAASLAMFHRICNRLFGRRPANLVLLGLFGTSVLLVPSFLWFADALHKFPSILASLIAIDAFLSYRLEGKRRGLLLCVAMVSLGSLFYMKVLLVPLYLFLIGALFLRRVPHRVWLAFVPSYVVYGVNYFVNYSDTGSAPPSLHLLGKYLWTAWFRGVTPAFAGVNVGVDATGVEVLYAVGAQLLLVAVIAVTIRRNPAAWRAWVFWGVAFAANATVVGLGRLGSLGFKQVGSQLRYDTEMTWLLPLALGFALFVTCGRSLRPLRLPRPRVVYAAGTLVACAYLAATIDTGIDNARDWRFKASNQAKMFVANMQHDAARHPGATVLDDQTPAFLIAPPHKPWNRVERLLPAITGKVRVVPGGLRPLEVHTDGRLTPIQIQAVSSGPTALTGAGAVARAGGVETREHGRRCVAGPATLSFTTERDLKGESLFGRVVYDVERRTARPAVLTGDSYRARPELLPLDRPRGAVFLDLGHLLRVALPAGAKVCLRGSEVGWLTP